MGLRSSVCAVLLASSLVIAGSPVHAEPTSPNAPAVHVIAIKSEDADDQAEALTVALRTRVRALRGWSLGEGDFSLEILTLGLKCAEIPDEACQAKIADKINSDRFIWGTLKKAPDKQVGAELHLWSRGHPATRAQVTYSENLTAPGDEALKRIVDEALAKLLPAGQKGVVVVKADPKESGEIFVDGYALGAMRDGEARLQLPPGDHLIELRRGSATQSASVNVRADAVVEVQLAPAKAAASSRPPASPSAGPSPVTSSGLEPEESQGASRVVGWTALGLGLALAGAGVYSVVRVHQIDTDDGFDRYRQGFHHGQDICDEARAGVASTVPGAATADHVTHLCSEASSLQTLQFVFFGLGAVSTAAGAYLLLSGPSTPSSRAMHDPAMAAGSRWQLVPRVGASAADLQLRLAF